MKIEPELFLMPPLGFGYLTVLCVHRMWVRQERLMILNPDPNPLLPLCPDFVIELRSVNGFLSSLLAKMQAYLRE